MEIWLFICGYLIHFVGSILLIWKILSNRSTYGLSSDTQICFLFSTLSRCLWSLDTRLVETKLAYLELFLSTTVAIVLNLLIYRYRHTNVKRPIWCFQAICTIPLAFILAVFIHPGNQWISAQILVAFTMYCEAIALVSQLYMMRIMIEVEPLTSHYVGLLVISRAVRLLFWLQLYYQGEKFLGLFVADLLHTILSTDYLILWFKKIKNGGRLIYSFE